MKKKKQLTQEQQEIIAQARKQAEIGILRRIYVKTKTKHAKQIVTDKALDIQPTRRNLDLD